MDDEAPCYSASGTGDESSTIVFLVPDDVMRMPLAYSPLGLIEYPEKVYALERLNVLRFKPWSFLHECSCIIACIK